MRWFSRLGTWLRASSLPDEAEAAQQELFDAFVSSPLPQTPPDRFRAALLRAVDTSVDHARAGIYRLDPTVQVLIIPPGLRRGDGQPDDRLTEDIDRAILQLSTDGRPLASLTWSALRDARPTFRPSYLDWSGDNVEHFEGNVGLVFFVDLEGIAHAAGQAAQALGFSTQFLPDKPAVIVTDGRFEAHVGINALIAEAVWTARGPAATVQKRTRALPAEFRTFLALSSGLGRRFPQARITHEGSVLKLRIDGKVHEVDYRHLAASVRAAGLGVDAFLARVRLDDIVADRGDPGLALRSTALLRAWPDALCEERDGHLLVAVRQDDDGRQRVVTTAPDDPPGRFAHYQAEAERQIGFVRFEAHVASASVSGLEAIIAVGDQIAGVLADQRLLRGLVDALVKVPDAIRAIATSEDTLLLVPTDLPPVVEEALLELGKEQMEQLASDLIPQGADPLSYDGVLPLGEHSAGTFELNVVEDAYFHYRTQAERSDPLMGARRAFLRGLSMRLLGRTEDAVGFLEQAFRADRDDGDVALVLGQAHFSLDDCASALPFLERANELLPESAEAANALGLAAWGMGHTAEASEAFERAVRLEPTETTFLVNLGRSYVDGHQFSKARACLERALRLEPDSAEAHASMALLCHRQGDTLSARRHARQALAEQPDDQNLRRLLSSLDDDDDEFDEDELEELEEPEEVFEDEYEDDYEEEEEE